uniref:GRAM domain-containing protein n=1 Tax=Hucho hucho TaxID=62062 RepID=A0A4W5NLZ6_9TELE
MSNGAGGGDMLTIISVFTKLHPRTHIGLRAEDQDLVSFPVSGTVGLMDQVSRSEVGSDVTDETASMGGYRWSSEDHPPVNQRSDLQGQCLAAPQALPAPTYKQRVEEFRKLFRELPESERLIVDYTCALQRDILLQGRLYLSENWLCFYSNVFWGTKVSSHMRERKNKGTVLCLGDELNWIMK